MLVKNHNLNVTVHKVFAEIRHKFKILVQQTSLDGLTERTAFRMRSFPIFFRTIMKLMRKTATTRIAMTGTRPTQGPAGFSGTKGRYRGSRTWVLTISV